MSVYYTARMLRSLLWSAGSLSRCKHIHALLPSPPSSPWRREVTQPLNAAGFLSRCVELQWECVKRAGRPNVKRGFWMVECFRMLTISNKLVSYMSSSLPFLNCSSRSLSDKHLAVSLQESIDTSILRFLPSWTLCLHVVSQTRPFPFLSHDRLQYGVSIVEVISGEKWKGMQDIRGI